MSVVRDKLATGPTADEVPDPLSIGPLIELLIYTTKALDIDMPVVFDDEEPLEEIDVTPQQKLLGDGK